jgi:adenylate cyclase
MSTDDVVDIAATTMHPRRRQVWLRVGIPIGGVALVIAAILAIALYSERANQSGVLLLSEDLLTTLQGRISQQVTAYLDPATRAARLARDMTAGTAIADPRSALEAFAASALRQIPQIDAFYTGDAAGNFMMVQRGTAGGTDTKTVMNAPGPRLVEWIRRGADDRVIGHETDPNDQFDPRTREWFQGALKSDDVYWTGVYVFFTRRMPGVTAAIQYHGTNGLNRVFGVDITLQALSDFLASLKIGRTGRAAIVDDTGHLIAAPDTTHMLRDSGGQLTTARVDQINDPVLMAAYDHFKVEGFGRRIIMVGDQPFVSIVSRLPASGRDWSLLMVAPEQDFTGFVANNGRRTLLLSLIVVALAAMLAALLVRQGLRADRAARLLLDRGRAIEQQNLAFANLARQPNLFDKTQQAPVQQMTQALVDLAGAQRAGVWHLLAGGQQMLCEDLYDRSSGGHSEGLRLTRAELPQIFAALEAGEVIDAPDAASDRRAAELYRTFLHDSRIRGVFVVPVRVNDRTIGAIMLEDASHVADAHEFILLTADLIAIRMRGATDAPATTRSDVAQVPPSATGERSLTAELVLRGLEGPLAADVFASAVVMVIRFSGAQALATKDASSDSTLADRIAAMMQDVAAAHDIPYMKLLGHDVIAAAGFTPDDAGAIVRIADAAIAIREHCLELFEVCGHPPQFRIGIDCGVAIGSHVGRQPRIFNLWGEAVRTAIRMAEAGAGPGTIQVSESAHRRLREQFLFRLRGRFYVPHAGAEQTFVLGGRQ